MTARKETKRVYKAVSYDEDTDTMSSWLLFVDDAYQVKNSFAVEYRIGEQTYPRVEGSLLFAFRTLRAAKAFADAPHSRIRILACEAKVSRQKLNNIAYFRDLDDLFEPDKSKTIVQMFWKYVSSEPSYWNIRLKQIPEDTVLCEWIRPISVKG